MRLGWSSVGDEAIRQAEIIDAIDPDTDESFQLWGQETPGRGVSIGSPAHQIELLDVLIPMEMLPDFANRVRSVKGRLPEIVEERLIARSNNV